MELAKGEGIAGGARRPRHQGRARWPGPRPSSTSSTPCCRSRASGLRRCGSLRATKNRFGSTEEVGVFEMAERGLRRGGRSGARVHRRARRPGSGQRRRADPRGQPAAARRGPGARRARRGPIAAADASGLDPNRLALLDRRPRPARRDRPREPRRLRQPRRRAARRRAGASTCRSRSPSPRRCAIGPFATGHGRDRRGRPARRAAARRAASSGGCARRPASGSRGRSCPDRGATRRRPGRAGRPRDRRGRWSRRCGRRSRPRSTPSPSAWRRLARDARPSVDAC